MKHETILIGLGVAVGAYFLLQHFNKRTVEPMTPGGVDNRNLPSQPSQIYPYRASNVNPNGNSVQTIGQQAYAGATSFNSGPQIPTWLNDFKNTASFLDSGKDIVSSIGQIYDSIGSWFGDDSEAAFE